MPSSLWVLYAYTRGTLRKIGRGLARQEVVARDVPLPHVSKWPVKVREGASAHFGSCMCLAPPVQLSAWLRGEVGTGAHRPNSARINCPLFLHREGPWGCVAWGEEAENLCDVSATVPRILSAVVCKADQLAGWPAVPSMANKALGVGEYIDEAGTYTMFEGLESSSAGVDAFSL